jgi:hypothetical protein
MPKGKDMLYPYFFERDNARSHLTLEEWQKAVESVSGVRSVKSPLQGLGEWIGYVVNPLGSPNKEFHDRPERAHDAEVFFPDVNHWFRAFYWYPLPERGLGVVTFESPPGNVAPNDYQVWVIARKLAAHLGAELVGANETAYE